MAVTSSQTTPSFSNETYEYGPLLVNAVQSFERYQSWALTNPNTVEEHVARYIQHLKTADQSIKFSHRVGQFINRSTGSSRITRLGEEISIFGMLNLGKLIPQEEAERIVIDADSRRSQFDAPAEKIDFNNPHDIEAALESSFPELASSEEQRWLRSKFQRLRTILPEFVIKDGGIGKVARTTFGVLTIASISSADMDANERKEHLKKTIMPAYFYGVTYPIIDDVFQDSNYISSAKDQQKYHDAICHGLHTGEDIDPSSLPDHPLTEEMLDVYNGIRDAFPFEENRELYNALEAMYLSQDRDAHQNLSELQDASDFYPYVSIKASLSRIVANLLAGRVLTSTESQNLINTLLRNQLLDDARDYPVDIAEGVDTPFTLAIQHPELPLGNPLRHLFAYEAFVAHEIYNGDPRATHVISKFGSFELGRMLGGNKRASDEMEYYFGDNDIISAVIKSIGGMSPKLVKSPLLVRKDKELEKYFGADNTHRNPQVVEPRTYISDSIGYINEILRDEFRSDDPVKEVIWYSLEAGGKRVRPALTLMLCESLGIDKTKIEPLLASIELAHTATLIFDDLPAQDNASLRRGRPTAHTQYAEYDAQLAGIAMISRSLGMLSDLTEHFPAERVNRVVEYVGTVLGAEKLCLGQHIDLSLSADASVQDILKMYDLKTSALLEGALVPLMILQGRSEEEQSHIKSYARHAGLVFQLRDDILDATALSNVTGKDSQQDVAKQNIVNLLGIEEAIKLLETHLQAAVYSCTQLPFPTDLLQNTVRYFASRTR